MRSDDARVRDAIEAIDEIARYAILGRPRFDADELVQAWMLRHLENLGEACRSVSAGLRDGHPEIPWSGLIGMRNVIAHQYFGISRDPVWVAVETVVGLRHHFVAILGDVADQRD